MKKIIVFLIPILIFSSDSSWLKSQLTKKNNGIKKEFTSELKFALITAIRLYRTFISSQDSHTCNFTVSCSRFSEKAIKKYGILFGLLIASDRLQRCVRWSRNYYNIDPISGLAVDFPLEYYYLR